MSRLMDRARAGRAVSAYEASRQQWADEVVHPEKLDMEGRGFGFGVGPDGPNGGRVYHQMRLPAHAETTRQLAGLYPFQAGRGTGAAGAYVGLDRFTRGPFLYDPWRMYEAGVVTNLNLLLVGVIGTGKSSLLKTLCLRLAAFGDKFFVPADTKGEMAALAKLIGAGHAALGPGLDKALSPLFAPPRPAWMTEDEYRQQIYQHRMTPMKSVRIWWMKIHSCGQLLRPRFTKRYPDFMPTVSWWMNMPLLLEFAPSKSNPTTDFISME